MPEQPEQMPDEAVRDALPKWAQCIWHREKCEGLSRSCVFVSDKQRLCRALGAALKRARLIERWAPTCPRCNIPMIPRESGDEVLCERCGKGGYMRDLIMEAYEFEPIAALQTKLESTEDRLAAALKPSTAEEVQSVLEYVLEWERSPLRDAIERLCRSFSKMLKRAEDAEREREDMRFSLEYASHMGSDREHIQKYCADAALKAIGGEESDEQGT